MGKRETFGSAADSPPDVVPDLPQTEIGEVIFYQAGSWRVDAIELATSQEADRRLVVSQVTD